MEYIIYIISSKQGEQIINYMYLYQAVHIIYKFVLSKDFIDPGHFIGHWSFHSHWDRKFKMGKKLVIFKTRILKLANYFDTPSNKRTMPWAINWQQVKYRIMRMNCVSTYLITINILCNIYTKIYMILYIYINGCCSVLIKYNQSNRYWYKKCK